VPARDQVYRRAQRTEGENKNMRHQHRSAVLWLAGIATIALGMSGATRADVTIEEQSTFDFSVIKAHGTSTELTTTDKQRRDTALNCEGFMSLLCGNAQSGEIIRLDREVQWYLEPKKQEYRATPFMTAAQRQEAEQQAQATLEKMKQCPAAKQSTAPAPNTSKCEMTPPKFDVKQTDTHGSFAGHDARLTQMAMTQSCRNNETGDVCDFVITLDAWLTQDQIAGLADRRAFESAYLQKLGLTDQNNALVVKQMRQFIAPYADSLKQISSKAGDFQGYPLKTAVRIAYGGEHCAAAKGQGSGAAGSSASGSGVVGNASQAAGSAAASSASGAAGNTAGTAATNAAGNGVASSILGPAASAFGSKLVSGLFAKKPAATSGTAGTSGTGTPNSTLAPGMIQAAEFTVETKSITTGPVPATQFDIPPGWKLVVPPAKAQKEFTCPKS
jgi:hypothetical protein